ncbi:MAG: hypothetical protein IJC50_00420 [Clostridia bacterium]|nr:hypothetical protein [Clostridia bacterium]
MNIEAASLMNNLDVGSSISKEVLFYLIRSAVMFFAVCKNLASAVTLKTQAPLELTHRYSY